MQYKSTQTNRIDEENQRMSGVEQLWTYILLVLIKGKNERLTLYKASCVAELQLKIGSANHV